MEVSIINHSKHALPQYATALSAGMDLRANLDGPVTLKPMERRLIPTGLYIALPEGYEALVVPRSSTPKKFGVICANSMGIIDNSYSGNTDEWKFPAIAIRDTAIRKGDRICQFRIIKNQPPIIFEEVEQLNEKSRGGFGSTGRR